MKKLLAIILSLVLSASLLASCTSPREQMTHEEANDLLAGITEDVIKDEGITVLLCGPNTLIVEELAREYENLYGINVNIKKYGEGSWDRFTTKVLSQDDDFDLFMPVLYQIAPIVRSGVYQKLNGYENIKSRIKGIDATEMLSNLDGTYIALPMSVQLFSTTDTVDVLGNPIDRDYTLDKYMFKHLDLFADTFTDPDGEEFFEVLKHFYNNPDETKPEKELYDFEINYASAEYLFLNKYSKNKDEAVDFLCFLFDQMSVESDSLGGLWLYPEVEKGVEYTPEWIYTTYEYWSVMRATVTEVHETDGSDETLRQMAEEAARELRRRLEG